MDNFQIKPVEPSENVRQAEVKKTKVLLGRMPIKKNCVVWECDLVTGMIIKAEVTSIIKIVQGRPKPIREVVVRENCIYDKALNGKNAVRKFERRVRNLTN